MLDFILPKSNAYTLVFKTVDLYNIAVYNGISYKIYNFTDLKNEFCAGKIPEFFRVEIFLLEYWFSVIFFFIFLLNSELLNEKILLLYTILLKSDW